VLHGFSATPHEQLWLCQALSTAGYTVFAPRLAGHGTDYRDLRRVHWRDWLASGLDAYYSLRQICQRVVLLGHSMGGALALTLAALPEVEVAGVAVLAAPYQLPSRFARWAGLWRFVMPYVAMPLDPTFQAWTLAEEAKRGETPFGGLRYTTWALNGVHQMRGLLAEMRAGLGTVRAPVCLVYATQDQTVPYAHRALFEAALGERVLEAHCIESGGHYVTKDVAHETVNAALTAFVARVTT
jgi:carboxylesterase